MRPEGVKASAFMAMRSELLTMLRDVDGEIDKAIKYRKSGRAFERAKALFAERGRIVGRLAELGIEVDDHPAVLAHFK